MPSKANHKILVISYHFPPLDAIASYRAKAYADYFYQFGITPTILTLNWEIDTEKSSVKDKWRWHPADQDVVYETHQTHGVIRLPRRKYTGLALLQMLAKSALLNKLIIIFRWVSGFFDSNLDALHSYWTFKSYLQKHLKHNQYDLIISIYSPHHHLRLAHNLHQTFKIPYVLDFRDLWNNQVASKAYHPNATEKIYDSLAKFYWNKWLKSASFFTITNSYWRDIMKNITATEGYVVSNGYDTLADDNNETTDFFSIHFAGALYPYQNVDIFLDGLTDLIEKTPGIQLKVRFMGLNERFFPGIHELIKKRIPSEHLEMLERKPKSEADRFIQQADILYFPAFDTIQGWCSVKIYDYLASKKNILVAPGDGGIVDEIINETRSGFVAFSPEEVVGYLKIKYNEWIKNGTCEFHGVNKKIVIYSRKKQVERFSFLIKQHV